MAKQLKYDVKFTRKDGAVRVDHCNSRAEAAELAAGVVAIVLGINPGLTVDHGNTCIEEANETMVLTMLEDGQFSCKIEAYPVKS
jgi:hypothetical protein